MKVDKSKYFIIGGIVVFVLLCVFFIVYFVMPSFSNDVYGDRLEGIEKHKISNSDISEIKENLSDKDGVSSVTYNREGKILNFVITTDGSISAKDAKKLSSIITDNISEKNQKYYDIQILLDSKKKTKGFPNIGYKNKSADEFAWGNDGD